MKMGNLSKEDHSMKYRMTTNANTKDVAEHSEQSWIRHTSEEASQNNGNTTASRYQKCNSDLRQKEALKNHSKACKGGKTKGNRN